MYNTIQIAPQTPRMRALRFTPEQMSLAHFHAFRTLEQMTSDNAAYALNAVDMIAIALHDAGMTVGDPNVRRECAIRAVASIVTRQASFFNLYRDDRGTVRIGRSR